MGTGGAEASPIAVRVTEPEGADASGIGVAAASSGGQASVVRLRRSQGVGPRHDPPP
jgi:hypothetical protein